MKKFINPFKKNSKVVGTLSPNVRQVAFQANGLYFMNLEADGSLSELSKTGRKVPILDLPLIEAEIIESFVKIETIIANDKIKREKALKLTRPIDNAVLVNAIDCGFFEIAANALIATNPLPVMDPDDVVKMSKLCSRILILHALTTASVLTDFDFVVDPDDPDAVDGFMWEELRSRFFSTRNAILINDAYPDSPRDWIDLFMRGIPSLSTELGVVFTHFGVIPSPEAFTVNLIYFLNRLNFPFSSAVLTVYSDQYAKEYAAFIKNQSWR